MRDEHRDTTLDRAMLQMLISSRPHPTRAPFAKLDPFASSLERNGGEIPTRDNVVSNAACLRAGLQYAQQVNPEGLVRMLAASDSPGRRGVIQRDARRFDDKTPEFKEAAVEFYASALSRATDNPVLNWNPRTDSFVDHIQTFIESNLRPQFHKTLEQTEHPGYAMANNARQDFDKYTQNSQSAGRFEEIDLLGRGARKAKPIEYPKAELSADASAVLTGISVLAIAPRSEDLEIVFSKNSTVLRSHRERSGIPIFPNTLVPIANALEAQKDTSAEPVYVLLDGVVNDRKPGKSERAYYAIGRDVEGRLSMESHGKAIPGFAINLPIADNQIDDVVSMIRKTAELSAVLSNVEILDRTNAKDGVTVFSEALQRTLGVNTTNEMDQPSLEEMKKQARGSNPDRGEVSR